MTDNSAVNSEYHEQRLFPKGTIWVASLLVLIIVVSNLVVYSTYITRGKIASLQELEETRDEMNVQWSQLVLEQNSLGSYARVEDQASKQLGMFVPTSKEIVMLKSVNFMSIGIASNP